MGNEIHGLKVKHLHVGGVLGSGEVQNGIRGCIQVKMDEWNIWFLLTDGWREARAIGDGNRHISVNVKAAYCLFVLFFSYKPLCLSLQGVRLGVRPDSPPLPRPSKAVKVETGCNVGNPCVSSPCPSHSRCSDQWERHACVCEPGEWTLEMLLVHRRTGHSCKFGMRYYKGSLKTSWEIDFLLILIYVTYHLCS